MKSIDIFLAKTADFLEVSQIIRKGEDLNFFATDWSGLGKPRASAILFPKSTAEVSKILSLASQFEIPVVPSGGRTGLSGGAVAENGEVVLSLTRLNHIGPIHTGALSLKVGAGAITEAVHEFCKPYGLTWPVDFASKGSSTVGGNLATNAGGVRVLRYGNARNWVIGLTVVKMDGTIIDFNHDLEKNNTGYDLRHLTVGSEGTLAVITEATLKLAALPKQTLVAMFSLPDFKSVTELFALARSTLPSLSAFECFDHACMESVTTHFKRPHPLKTPGKTYVLMEVEDVAFEEVEAEFEKVLGQPYVLDAVMAQNEKEARAFWTYREGIAESILAHHKVHQEDVSVPIPRLVDFYGEIETRYARALPDHAVFFFGHIGDGNLHIFIQKPAASDEKTFVEKMHSTDAELFKILAKYHGSISAEHGIGILKKHALHYSRTPDEIEIFRGIKRAFDPKGLLNPGKVIV